MKWVGLPVLASLVVAASLLARPARAADPSVAPTTAGCLSAAESSLALRSQHKLRDARAHLLICSAPSCPADVRTECIRRVTELNLAIPTVVFEAKDPAGNDLSDVKVTMDGQLLAERLDGPALTIDPGVHLFTFEVPGQPAVQKRFVIREGDKDRRERVTLGTAPAPANPSAIEAPPPRRIAGPPTDRPPPRSDASSERGGTQRTIGVILGVVGVAALGTGLAFSFKFASDVNTFNTHDCSTMLDQFGPTGCVPLHDTDELDKKLYIAGYVSGAVLISVGAILFFSAPSEAPASSNVALRSRRFSLRCLPTIDAGVTCGGRF